MDWRGFEFCNLDLNILLSGRYNFFLVRPSDFSKHEWGTIVRNVTLHDISNNIRTERQTNLLPGIKSNYDVNLIIKMLNLNVL